MFYVCIHLIYLKIKFSCIQFVHTLRRQELLLLFFITVTFGKLNKRSKSHCAGHSTRWVKTLAENWSTRCKRKCNRQVCPEELAAFISSILPWKLILHRGFFLSYFVFIIYLCSEVCTFSILSNMHLVFEAEQYLMFWICHWPVSLSPDYIQSIFYSRYRSQDRERFPPLMLMLQNQGYLRVFQPAAANRVNSTFRL